MNSIHINIQKGEKLEVSSNWRSAEKDPPNYDEIVIVLYCTYSVYGYWEDYETTVAKYKGWEWIDCFDPRNSDLTPIYWRPFPGAMD